jgi:hypothetical protein
MPAIRTAARRDAATLVDERGGIVAEDLAVPGMPPFEDEEDGNLRSVFRLS